MFPFSGDMSFCFGISNELSAIFSVCIGVDDLLVILSLTFAVIFLIVLLEVVLNASVADCLAWSRGVDYIKVLRLYFKVLLIL